MIINNFSTLKQAVMEYSHRTDIENQLQGFANSVSQALDRRFGTDTPILVNDTDSNDYLAHNPDLYLYGCLREVGVYTHDQEMIAGADSLYQQCVRDMNINYSGTEWDTTPPVMEPYDAT